MTRSIGLIVMVTLLSASAGAAPPTHRFAEGHQSGEETAVLQALDRFVTAISETDLDAQAAMQMPEGMTFTWRPARHASCQRNPRARPPRG